MSDETIERCAQAAYEATMTMRPKSSLPFEPWEKLPEYWKRIYRTQVRAMIVAHPQLGASDAGDWAGHPEAPVSEDELQQLITEDYSGGKLAWR